MAKDNRDILEVLKFELQFLEQGGYGRSVRTPWKATSIFQDSPSCLNFNDAERPHPCSECLLIDFVPPTEREQDVPCHHIPMGPKGETVSKMESSYSDIQKEEAVKDWLRAMIARLEREQQLASERGA
jgi:hypothetical protein